METLAKLFGSLLVLSTTAPTALSFSAISPLDVEGEHRPLLP
jgi:hypothetical protein